MLAMTGTDRRDESDAALPVRRRREVPPFPWESLRYILTLGGDYCPDTTAKAVPIATRNLTGIRWQSFEHPERAAVATAVARAFGESRLRHNLQRVHWNIFMACEIGMMPRPDQKGAMRWGAYRLDRPDAVMPDDEAARMFEIRPDLVRRYHGEARKAIQDEWIQLYSGYEG